jgi:phosphatidylglycerol:prolipoprotein diacylglycerol transferase
VPSLNEIYQSINPVAFTVGPFSVYWYGVCYLIGFVLGGLILFRVARRWKLDLTPDDVMTIIIGIAFGVIIGGRLGYVLFYGAGYYLSHPLEILATNEGGMSFHGGLVGAIIGGSIACRHLRISIPTICDIGVIAACPGIFFVRCANFINGELWGKACDLPWAVCFETGGGIPRHPSQLYEALLEGLLMLIVLYVLSRRSPARPQGTFFGTFLTLYGVFRILIEFVRVPDAQLGYLWGPITMGQVLSVPLVVAGIVVLWYSRRLDRPQVAHLDAPDGVA